MNTEGDGNGVSSIFVFFAGTGVGAHVSGGSEWVSCGKWVTIVALQLLCCHRGAATPRLYLQVFEPCHFGRIGTASLY